MPKETVPFKGILAAPPEVLEEVFGEFPKEWTAIYLPALIRTPKEHLLGKWLRTLSNKPYVP